VIGTLIILDGMTRNLTFGHYTRILVDIDLSKRAYHEILVEREGFTFKVEVQYERRPLFFHHYYSIGCIVSTCRWTHPQIDKAKNDHGKQPIVAKADVPKLARQQHDVEASTSANGSSWTWVLIPVTSTVTTTQRVPVPSAFISLASQTQTILASIPSSAMKSITQMVSVPIVSLTMASSQTKASAPSPSLLSSSFSFPLHNVFDCISAEEFPRAIQVMEVVSPVEHDGVHFEEVERSHQTSREELEIPTIDDVTLALLDGVEHNH